MKPVKPKKMPKALTEWLKDVCEGRCAPQDFETSDARSILAALEYERQRADKALDHIASHAEDFGGTPRGQRFDAFLVANGRPRAALTFGERHSPTFQREQTAAVVPPKRKGKAVTHARTDGYDVRRERPRTQKAQGADFSERPDRPNPEG